MRSGVDEPRWSELPRARRDGLLEREVNDDLVVYDLECHRAYSLDRAARRLWRWCDGATPIASLRQRTGRLLDLPPEDAEPVVEHTLLRLADAGLLVGPAPTADRPDAYDRRRCLGALVALPVVAGILVPRAADAQSLPNGSPCSSNSQCDSGCCNSSSNRCSGGGPSCL